ncbi:cytochrome P450 [Aspergillus phoenicis ATCC 13157]|uniref:Bifunctional cytochrome P450/NADPH--P450 reductase n=1 Tax=Aspergillus phoenicis ATCC 13157 TaxID=1353007 RepID=A0A370PV70_ASPPH|nr:cytochrome P450 [Aspergillus phoenicis ATCC 13157]
MSDAKIIPIPGPRPLPLLGNILDFDLDNLTQSLDRLSKAHGPIYALTFGSSTEIMVTSRRIAEELCDETRFCKLVAGGLEKMKPVVGDGLFTAQSDDPKWAIAHRILMPLFGTMKIREMFNDMKDICEQMCLKWARLGESFPLDVCKNFTTLTLDTISLCTIDYRFNSFYRDGKEDPFVEGVIAVMTDAFTQSNLPDFVNNWFRHKAMADFHDHAQNLRRRTEEIIQERRRSPVERNDLLNAMLTAVDPKTGERLSDQSVVDNLLTFLIAGHETTSSLLSFCFYYLLENPDVLQKARDEVDQVIGDGPMMVEHLQKLPYIESILRETLRLRDPGPGFYLKPLKDDILDGKYYVKKDQPIFIVFDSVHRDPETYGSDANNFRPSRMSQENFEKLPPCAWKPFGNGVRSCIGRPFAWQQSLLAVAMILQNFDLIKDETYKLKYHVTMTVRPVGFHMKVRLRRQRRATDFAQKLHAPVASQVPLINHHQSIRPNTVEGSRITILHGSNAGSCEALALRLAADAGEYGFTRSKIEPLGSAVGKLPTDNPVIIITASYNGEPADEASDFVAWLKTAGRDELSGVSFSVFGCGHRDWASTYFAVPKLLDAEMERAGGRRIAPLGTADSATSDLFTDLEKWSVTHLFPGLGSTEHIRRDAEGVKVSSSCQVMLSDPPRVTLRKGFVPTSITESRCLSQPGVPEKRHLELRLPDGFTYQPGDHLYVLPRNSPQNVQRVLSRFHLEGDMLLTLTRSQSLGLPVNTPISASDLFGAYVELRQIASPKGILALADSTPDSCTQTILRDLAGDLFKVEIQDKYVSVLDLLERFPTINPSIGLFLSLLTPMRPRAYSFSSSPNEKPGYGTLTYTVVGSVVHDGEASAVQGIASNHLATLRHHATLYIALHPCTAEFRLPSDNSRPLVMVAAGTGLAPFRGFIQERRFRQLAGKKVGPALLFYGCRGRDLDDMYRDEMDGYEKEGVVSIHRAYSRVKGADFRYIDSAIARFLDHVVSLWASGGVVRVCGGKKMSNSVFEVLGPALLERDRLDGKTDVTDVAEWKRNLPRGRYVEEIFL